MMPALFVGHGSPMYALEENEFYRRLHEVARQLPKPKSVLCISAHWETDGVFFTASDRPETIHDFYGFPKELFDVRYPAPGDPALARRAAALLSQAGADLDMERGLDHGCWSVLRAMYPEAGVPVVQLSLDRKSPALAHYHLATQLAPLRCEQVLIVGTGNIVHNLGMIDFRRADGLDWAVRFNEEVKRRILAGDHEALAATETLGPEARLAVPDREHYLPLLYALAVKGEGEKVSFFNDKIVMGSISMTSVLVGG
jgi:4,5-DOPA dioxygenase extradiol